MSKLSYEDKINIYQERKNGNAISNISKKYNVKKNVIEYLVRLIDKHGYDVLKSPEVKLNDFIEKAGMSDEFMGRIRVIKMNDLDVSAIKKILNESDESILNIQRRLFEKEGVILNATDEYKDEVASLAYEMKTGARGLNNVVEESTSLAYQDVLENPDKYSEIILTGDTVKNPKNYEKQLVKTIYN